MLALAFSSSGTISVLPSLVAIISAVSPFCVMADMCSETLMTSQTLDHHYMCEDVIVVHMLICSVYKATTLPSEPPASHTRPSLHCDDVIVVHMLICSMCSEQPLEDAHEHYRTTELIYSSQFFKVEMKNSYVLLILLLSCVHLGIALVYVQFVLGRPYSKQHSGSCKPHQNAIDQALCL